MGRIANQDSDVLIRCVKYEQIGTEKVAKVRMLHPNVVRNDWLLKATGCVVDDPLADEKLGKVVNLAEQVKSTVVVKWKPDEKEVVDNGDLIVEYTKPVEKPTEEKIVIQASNVIIESLESEQPEKIKRKRTEKTKSKK